MRHYTMTHGSGAECWVMTRCSFRRKNTMTIAMFSTVLCCGGDTDPMTVMTWKQGTTITSPGTFAGHWLVFKLTTEKIIIVCHFTNHSGWRMKLLVFSNWPSCEQTSHWHLSCNLLLHQAIGSTLDQLQGPTRHFFTVTVTVYLDLLNFPVLMYG